MLVHTWFKESDVTNGTSWMMNSEWLWKATMIKKVFLYWKMQVTLISHFHIKQLVVLPFTYGVSLIIMFDHIIQHITSIDTYKNLQQLYTGCHSALPEKFNSWLADLFQLLYDIWEAEPRSYHSPIITILFKIIKRLGKLVLNFPIKILHKGWKLWTLHSQNKMTLNLLYWLWSH